MLLILGNHSSFLIFPLIYRYHFMLCTSFENYNITRPTLKWRSRAKIKLTPPTLPWHAKSTDDKPRADGPLTKILALQCLDNQTKTVIELRYSYFIWHCLHHLDILQRTRKSNIDFMKCRHVINLVRALAVILVHAAAEPPIAH